MVLDEYNYIKGFSGDDWKYSIKVEKSLKGAAFIASVMCMGQHEPLDMLMYYDARPSGMNGMFAHETYECLKGYYPFLAFRELAKLGTHIPTEYAVDSIYNCCATDGDNYALMLTHFNDDDSTQAKNVKVNFENCTSPVKVSISILDKEHNLELTKEEYFTADKFSVILEMPLFTTILIKIEKQ